MLSMHSLICSSSSRRPVRDEAKKTKKTSSWLEKREPNCPEKKISVSQPALPPLRKAVSVCRTVLLSHFTRRVDLKNRRDAIQRLKVQHDVHHCDKRLQVRDHLGKGRDELLLKGRNLVSFNLREQSLQRIEESGAPTGK